MMNVKAEILDYINCNVTTGALLLTGPWGCGKSHLMKDIAKELNSSKDAAVTVISLFGLDCISAINKRVKEEYTSFRLGAVGKAVKTAAKRIAKVSKDTLKVAESLNPGNLAFSAASQGLSAAMSYDILSLIEVQNTIGKETENRKFVIVFDDLERCGIGDKKDLLGAINEFVENKQIKVIVVADEEKINEKEYAEYKEKLISRTIHMSADYDTVIESIVSDYNETRIGYKDFLTENLDLLKQVFHESQTDNIRTFICILADFERVYDAWIETKISTENMKWALYTFGAEVYISKSPKEEIPKSSQGTIWARLSNEKNGQYSYKGKAGSTFFSVCDWATKGIWNKEQFAAELCQKYAMKDENPIIRFLSYNLWDLQQKDIEMGLPAALKLAYDGDLSRDQLLMLISKIHLLKINSITLSVNVEYKQIEEGLEKRFIKIKNNMITEPQSHKLVDPTDVDEEAVSLFNKIKRFENRMISVENRKDFFNYLLGDESITRYTFNSRCVEEFDEEWLDLFIEKYTLFDNSRKRDFARAFLSLTFNDMEYSTKDNIRHTNDNLSKLKSFLETMNPDDNITEIINKMFAEEIGKIQEKFTLQ